MTLTTGQPTKTSFNPFPLVLPAAAFACGILVERAFALNVMTLTVGVLLFGALSYLFRNRPAAVLPLIAAFLVAGSLSYYAETKGIRNDRLKNLIDSGLIASGDPVELEGRLSSPPEMTPDGVIVDLSAERLIYRGEAIPATGSVRIYVTVADEEALTELEVLDLSYGSRVGVACQIMREEAFQNPGVSSRLDILDRQGIDATASIKSPLLIEKLGEGRVFLPLAWVYRLRQRLIEQFRERFTVSTAGVLSASLLGDKYFLDKPTADVFREGGTFHVLVISGLHITFIGGLLLAIAGAFTRSRFKLFIVVATVLWAYTFGVGADVPVVRASLMFTVLLFSQTIYRRGTLLNSLAFCVLLLLAWRPSDILNPSFQLTVVSVTAIVVMAFPLIEKLRAAGSWIPSASTPFPPNIPGWLVRICETLYWRPAAWNIEQSRQIWSGKILKRPYLPHLVGTSGQACLAFLFEGVLVSLVVQVWLLPFLVLYFHRVTPISILMNLWVGFVLATESFSALAAVILGQFGDFLASPFLSLTEFLNYLLVSAPSQFLNIDMLGWRIPHYSGGLRSLYAICFVPVVVLAFSVWKWDPFAILRIRAANIPILLPAAATIGMLILIILHPFSAPQADRSLHIDFLDVGQGDSAFVTFPDGTTMLIDGGGRLEYRETDDSGTADETFIRDLPGIGESIVSTVLWEKGYSHVDYVLATHADADHIDGLVDVVRNFSVGKAYFGRMPSEDPEFARLETALGRRGVGTEFVSRGRTMQFGGATVEVLYPLADLSPQAVSDNDHSVVVRIVYGNREFLLTGDIERGAETQLLAGGGTLKADVVKVAHHGSRTSSSEEFIKAAGARFAVISVGRRSRFGHPHQEVIERWKAAGSAVMTTGEKGMISISTDGRDLNIETFR